MMRKATLYIFLKYIYTNTQEREREVFLKLVFLFVWYLNENGAKWHKERNE